MTIKEIRKMGGCCADIDKMLLTYNDLMREAAAIKDGEKSMQRRQKLTALYRGQLLSLIEDFQNNKL